MAATFTHKRRFPRIPSDYPVLVRRLGDEALEKLGRTSSLGLGGCAFLSEESFGVASLVELLISIDMRVVSAPGRIVYENRASPAGFEIGVEFLELGADERRILGRLFNLDF